MRPVRLFRSHRTRRGALVLVLVVLSLVALAGWAAARFDVGPRDVTHVLDGFGPFAPAAFVLLQAAQVVAAPVPGQVLSFAAGYLFGPYWGTAYSVAGAALGSYVAFRLARTFGRPYVERVVNPAAMEWFDAVARENGLLALFVVFLVPGLPDDLVCFAGGLTDLDVRKMTAVAVVGRTPGFFLAALAGSNTAHGEYADALVIAGVLTLAGGVVWLYRDRVRDALAG